MLSCFELTIGLCDELSSMIGRWWWSQNNEDNKIHWLAWDKLTLPKNKGGLGFRDLYLFNQAMLARQAWRLLVSPYTLCGQVLKAKYFPNGTILQCEARDGISYTWRSILKGVDLIKEGVIWRIGNGESVNIWTDPWIPHGKTRRPATYRGAAVLTRVVDLLDPVSGSWDETLVKDTFSEFDAEAILKLRVNPDMEDRHAWHFDKKGLFSVKSAYKLAVQRRENEMGRNAASSESLPVGNSGFRWDKIWGMEVPNKVKMFIWRLVHNSLAVR